MFFKYRWDPPSKNPNAVEGYRIFYHEASPSPANAPNSSETSAENTDTSVNATSLNSTEIRRIDVKDTTVSIDGLQRNVLYELVVKAGNNFGKLLKCIENIDLLYFVFFS